MNKRERVIAALKGEPVDMVPISFFGHFFDKEQNAEDLSECMINFFNRYDLDFMKIHSRFQVFAEIWGSRYQYSKDPLALPTSVNSVLNNIDDWDMIEVKGPDSDPFPELLHVIKQIRKSLGPNVPILSTILSPIFVASTLMHNLFDQPKLMKLIREAPDRAEKALQAIAETLSNFAPKCLEAGADGIFFGAGGFPADGWLMEEEYLKFVKPNELKVLESCRNASFNMVHISGNRFDLVKDYPVQSIHWIVDVPGNPNVAEGLKMTQKTVAAGVSEQKAFADSSPEELRVQTRDALKQSGSRRHLIAVLLSQFTPTCKPEQIRAVIDEVRNFKMS